MSDEPDPPGAAFQNFRKRELEAQHAAAERERAACSRERIQRENLSLWSTTASHTILLGVQRFSDEFAR
jgi:hypothetical protein